MEKKEYTEQQKADAVKRAVEIGVQAAAKELGIPWQALAQWNKSAGNPTVRGMNKEKKAAKASAAKTTSKKSEKPSALEIRNAVLKSENQELKAQIAKLKKALSNLM